MDVVEVTTVVYLPPEELYDFIVDFPRYSSYTEHLKEVRQHGDGDPGTEYELDFSWWKLRYTARSQVTDADRPRRVDWRVTKDIDARGYWKLDPVDPPEGRDHATEVTMRVTYDAESADPDLSLPRFVSLSSVIEKAKPVVEREAERVVRRIVTDLEGESREVDLEIRTG